MKLPDFGLNVEGISHAKSDKLNPQLLAPRHDLHQRGVSPQLQGEQLGQCIRRGANLHPQFQLPLRLLPQVCTPPSASGCETKLDTPNRGSEGHERIVLTTARATTDSPLFIFSLLPVFAGCVQRATDRATTSQSDDVQGM